MVRSISPELVLVDPELARAERARLLELARLAALRGDVRAPTEVVSGPVAPPGSEAPRRARRRDVVLFAAVVLSLAANVLLAALVVARNRDPARRAEPASPATGAVEAAPPATRTRTLVQDGARNAVVERHMLRWLARAPTAALPPTLRNGRSQNDFETVCLASGTRGRYRCVVHPVGKQVKAVFAVQYPAPAEGGALVEWLP